MTKDAITWQAVVKRYLDAYVEDVRSKFENAHSTEVAAFFDDYASENVSSSYRVCNLHKFESVIDPPTVVQWKVVRETKDDVLVEIPRTLETDSSTIRVPSTSIRILLMRSSDDWKIFDILDSCLGCNLDRHPDSHWKEGECRFCVGRGILHDEPCMLCNGSGKCSKCHAEAMPGWLRSSSLNR